MLERVKRDWWIPAPILLIGYGLYAMLTHIAGDGSESPWSYTEAGWDPSLLERAGSVALLGGLLVVLPAWALWVRRSHPSATFALLLPYGLMSLVPLMWGDPGSMLVFPALGVVILVGALANLAQQPSRAK